MALILCKMEDSNMKDWFIINKQFIIGFLITIFFSLLNINNLLFASTFKSLTATEIAYGYSTVNSISQLGEKDEYTFQGNTDDLIIARMLFHKPNLDPVIQIFDPDGKLVENGELRISNGTYDRKAAELSDCKLEKDGKYTILLSDINGDSTGNYSFYFQKLNSPTATEINYNHSIVASISPSTEMDEYSFYGNANDIVLCRMIFHQDNLDPAIQIFDAIGMNLTRCEMKVNNGTYDRKAAESTCKLIHNGNYTIFLSDLNGDSTGNYSFSFKRSNSSIVISDNNHWYQRFDISMTWLDAKQYCENNSGYLATLTSKQENDFVYNNLVINSSNKNIWLGATDEDQEGIWRWITDESWNYTNWAETPIQQPDNFDNQQHYLHFWMEGNVWADLCNDNINGCKPEPDKYKSMSFICEWDNDTPNNPPYISSSCTPSNNSSDNPVQMSIQWSGGDPDPDTILKYNIYFGDHYPPSQIDTYTSTNYDLNFLDYGTTYYWQIKAEDNYGAVGEGPIWQFSTISNKPPDKPVIKDYNFWSFFPPGPVTLELNNFSDAEGDNHYRTYWKIRKAGFYYSCDGEYEGYCYTATTNNPIELTEYTFNNLAPGMRYFWKAGFEDDYSSCNISWSDEYSFIIGNKSIDNPGNISAGIDKNKFQMVSFVQWPNDSKATNIFGGHIGSNYEKDFRIGTYDPLNNSYIEYNSDLTIEPGKAYWFLARTGLDIQIEGISVSLDLDIDIPIQYDSTNGDGWNMIGCPNKANYKWGNIQVLQYNEDSTVISGPFSLSDAANQDLINLLIENKLWYWNNGAYNEESSSDFVLEFYKGYWVKVKSNNVVLRFPKKNQMKRRRNNSQLTQIIRNSQSLFKTRLFFKPKNAYADSQNTPPPPMRGFTGDSIEVGSSGGCYLSTLWSDDYTIFCLYKSIAYQFVSIIILLIAILYIINYFSPLIKNSVHKYNYFCYFSLIIIMSLSLLNNVAFAEEKGAVYSFDEGRFYFLEGKYDEAKKYLKEAHEKSPKDAFYNQYLGKLFLELEEYEEAYNFLMKAQSINPNIFGLTYDIAILFFHQKKYIEASNLFIEIIENTKSDVRNSLSKYYNGLCLFKQKKYKKSIDYLKEAANQSPTLKVSANYYIGICELKLGYVDKCVQRLNRVVLESKLQGLYDLEKFASSWLLFIEKRKKALKPYYFFCKLYYQFDDNVFLNPDNENLYVDKNDFSAIGFISLGYDIFKHKEYLVSIGYSRYQSWYNDHSLFDMTGSIFDLKASYKYKNDLKFSFLYMPSFYRIDHKSVINRHTFTPKVRWRLSDDFIADFLISFDLNNNINDERDGNASEVLAALYHNVPKSNIFVFGKLGFENRSADHTDYEYNNIKIESGTSLNVLENKNMILKCTINYFQKTYKHSDITYRSKRKDSRYGINLDISYTIMDSWIRLNSEYQFINNVSNINKFEYKKNILMLSVTYDY